MALPNMVLPRSVMREEVMVFVIVVIILLLVMSTIADFVMEALLLQQPFLVAALPMDHQAHR